MASITALSLAVIGIAAATPLFFTLVTEYLSAAAAAACIALISSPDFFKRASYDAVFLVQTGVCGEPRRSVLRTRSQWPARMAFATWSRRCWAARKWYTGSCGSSRNRFSSAQSAQLQEIAAARRKSAGGCGVSAVSASSHAPQE